MNFRFAHLAIPIAMAVLSLALFITAAEGTASCMSDEAIGIAVNKVIREGTDNRLLANQRPNISHNEPLPTTELISIYLPLQGYDYVDPKAERAALLALNYSTSCGIYWNPDVPYCDWVGVWEIPVEYRRKNLYTEYGDRIQAVTFLI